MPFPAKTKNVSALAMKTEATYGTYTAPSFATDAILLALSDRYTGLVKKSWMYDGKIGPAPGHLGQLPRNTKVGAQLEADFPMRMKGFGAAYSAANRPNVHVPFVISGMDGTFSGSVGTEKWTYTITDDASLESSASFDYQNGGQIYKGAGALANLSYEARGGGPPLFKFAVKAIQASDVVDGALSAATYPNLSVMEPNAFGGVFTLGAYLTAAVRSCSFESGRGLDTVRPNLNGASSHLGWLATEWNPRLTVTIERTAFVGSPFHTASGIDYYKLAEAATQVVGLIQFGTVQYNRMKHNLPLMQLADASEGNDGGVATVDLMWEPVSSAPNNYDFMNFVFD